MRSVPPGRPLRNIWQAKSSRALKFDNHVDTLMPNHLAVILVTSKDMRARTTFIYNKNRYFKPILRKTEPLSFSPVLHIDSISSLLTTIENGLAIESL